MNGVKRSVLAATMMLATSNLVWAQGHISWLEDIGQARQLANQQQRLVLIHFWSPNCPPCLRLEQRVFNRPEVVRTIATSYVPLKVNVERDRALAARYHVTKWPTDVIISASGEEVFRGVSQQDPNRYMSMLTQVAAHARLNMPAVGSSSTASAPKRHSNRAMAQTSGYGAVSQSAYRNTPAADRSAQQGGRYARQESYAGGSQVRQASQSQSVPNAEVQTAYGGGFQLPGSRSSAPAAAAFGGPNARPTRPQAQPPSQPQVTNNRYVTQPATSAPRAAASAWRKSAVARRPEAEFAREAPAYRRPAEQVIENQTASFSRPQPSQPSRTLQQSPTTGPLPGMESYCAVTLVEREQWVKGDARWGVMHRGRLFLFVGPEEQQRFLADFDKYAPVLSGYDPVLYAQQGTLSDGKRAHGIFYQDRVYLFVNETTLQTFWADPERFASVALAGLQSAGGRQRR